MRPLALWALARLREPSTWAGLAGLVASMTFLPHAAEIAALIPSIGAGFVALASLAAIALSEKTR
jgi:hypothetical protein